MKIVINTCYGGFGLSDKADKIMDERSASYKEDGWYFVERHDPILISVVEMLGKEADGTCSELEIIEIPDGLSYDIREYDGYESLYTYLAVSIKELVSGLSEEKLSLLNHTKTIKIK